LSLRILGTYTQWLALLVLPLHRPASGTAGLRMSRSGCPQERMWASALIP